MPESSASVIENITSQIYEENKTCAKGIISDANDLINNNNSKKDEQPLSPHPDSAENETSVILNEKLPDKVPVEKSENHCEKSVESTVDKTDKDEYSSSSSSASEGSATNKDALVPPRITTLKNCDASEEDNAISGTDSGGVSTPMQRRYSEIHLGEPAMLKEAIESSLKEVLSSAGSDSETQEELAAALRRKLYQRQVSETLISEIEEIIKEKILENIINDGVTAITDKVNDSSDPNGTKEDTKVANATEEAYRTTETDAKGDRYIVSVNSSKSLYVLHSKLKYSVTVHTG